MVNHSNKNPFKQEGHISHSLPIQPTEKKIKHPSLFLRPLHEGIRLIVILSTHSSKGSHPTVADDKYASIHIPYLKLKKTKVNKCNRLME